MSEALALLPADWPLTGVRADAGFFDQKLLAFLEERALPYIVVAKRKQHLLNRLLNPISGITRPIGLFVPKNPIMVRESPL